jgi:hypothetical protein
MSEQSTQASGNTPSTASAQPAAAAAAATGTPAAAPAAGAPAAAPAAAAPVQQASTAQSAEPAKPGASTEGQQGTQAGDKPAGAPEKYEFKAPAGVALSDAVTAEFSAVAKELNLPQDAAQKVLDRIAPKLAQGNADAIANAMKTVVDKWAQDAKVDKEFGGEKLSENLAVASKAVERFASPELRALLNPYHPRTTRAEPGWATTRRWCGCSGRWARPSARTRSSRFARAGQGRAHAAQVLYETPAKA